MEADRIFQGPIPALYDQHLGPMIFAPYASDLASRLTGLRRGRVLETAAGTGIVTRALLSALPDEVSIDATDINQAMLDRASGLISSPRVTWRQADAQSLPFPDGMFDAVVCQFGAMFFPDKVQAFSEAHRVLKPGGRFLLNVWDRIEANEFADVVVRSVARLFPDDPPMFLARTPHGFHDVAALEVQLRAAGFGSVTSDTVTRQSSAPDALFAAIGYCQGSPMRKEIEDRAAGRLAEATEAAAAAIAARFGPGPVVGQIQAHVITAGR
ncbi:MULTISPECIES: class I SAM-dependent methyltransferase [Inquilinus]|uniref:Ubiquinone/menaquinone biosynthesis C-methylase UbiE n=1 Tax=Inquilinus ginsengisoli TaxID=363840 RepID=A0ABU1JVI1_9PROT|nr:methyltransferase domain-containing protein [Inquilinus ginsengisoli]MDR6292019.1 ubiquinone/menaquinone biosynthesis C-methylase UbiE [Inquilinus ginsengisoli]